MVLQTYSLDAYAGQTIYVAFKNKNDEGRRIFIDNVELGTRPAAEAGIISVDVEDFIPTGLSTPPRYRCQQWGDSPDIQRNA